MARRTRMLPISLLLTTLLLLPLASSVGAWGAWPRKWFSSAVPSRSASELNYRIDANLDAQLNLPGASTAITNASNAWFRYGLGIKLKNAGTVANTDNGSIDAYHRNVVTSRWTGEVLPFGCGSMPITTYARTCHTPAVTNVTSNNFLQGAIFINRGTSASNRLPWNVQGNNTTSPLQLDVYKVLLHEFGHLLGLGHNPSSDTNNVMYPAHNNNMPSLPGDNDARGIVQMYGPDTGFESDQVHGLTNVEAYWQSTDNRYLGLPTVSYTNPQSGTGQIQLSGRATGTYSYMYDALFSRDETQPNWNCIGVNPIPAYCELTNLFKAHLVIDETMELGWCQYNWDQYTMGIDMELERPDGSIVTMRDFQYQDEFGQWRYMRDSNGFRTHPKERRYAQPRFEWRCHKVLLGPMAGLRLRKVFVAYDNDGVGIQDYGQNSGWYVGFFDNLSITGIGPLTPDKYVPSNTLPTSLQPLGLTVKLPGIAPENGSVTVSPPPPHYASSYTNVTYTATPNSGYTFVGWWVDGKPRGWANPLNITMDKPHAVTPIFVPTAANFSDVPTNHPYYGAIREIANRGISVGYGNGYFGIYDNVQRAQVAAFVTRSLYWNHEDWGNPFTDQNGLDATLWRNVGTLQHYGVANGCTATTFCPTANVTHAETIAFITRAMVQKGYWQMQGAGNCYGAPSVFCPEVRTYDFYTTPVGGIPFRFDDQCWNCGVSGSWNVAAKRGWYAEAQWRALHSYFR